MSQQCMDGKLADVCLIDDTACQWGVSIKEPFSPHGRGLVTIVYVVKRSFQFDMKQDTCHVKGRKFTCKVWRTSWKRALNDLFAVL